MLINTSTDLRNIGFAKILFYFRQHLGVYRTLALNSKKINEVTNNNSFFSYLRAAAIEGITLCICKLYEPEKSFELDSIDGLFKELTTASFVPKDFSKTRAFVSSYGGNPDLPDILQAVEKIIEKFKKDNKLHIDKFKTYRDKFVAHGESHFKSENLPSYDVIERLYNFGYNFYSMISEDFIGAVPALMKPYAETGLRNLIIQLGVDNPKIVFDD